MICDPHTGENAQTFDLPAGIDEVVWLNVNTMVVLIRSGMLCLINLADDASLRKLGSKGVNRLDLPPLDTANKNRHWITRITDNSIAYIDRGNVWSLSIPTAQTRQLSHVTGATLEWLDYNPSSGEFLFSLTDKKHNDALYRLKPDATNELAAIIGRDERKRTNAPVVRVLKGQWVLGGKGVAYVKESLFVQAKDFTTNLFREGYVQSYSVSPDGNRIFALASTGDDPLCIWEYDIPTRQLRNAVPATEKPFATTEIIPIQEGRYSGQNGKRRILYSYLPPADMQPDKKYPALVCVPHGSRWAADGQLVANAGIFYVFSPSQSGITNAGDLPPEAQYMLTANHALRNNPNVDSSRIYLMGESHQTTSLTRLLERDPGLWRGVVFAAPVAFPSVANERGKFPSILISIGEGDKQEYKERVEQFVRTADHRQLPVRVRYDQKGGHILASTDVAKERYESIIKFILSGY